MLVILLACMQAPQEAKNIQLEGKPLNEAIAAMESRLEVHEKEVAQDMLVLMNRMKKVEDRLKTLEIAFTDIRPQSYSAQDISFVPTATKISSTQLQGALEEIEKREALDKYGSEGSGKNLPFSSLSEDLKKKEKKK